MAYNVGEAPSLFCAFDRHAECADRDYRNCTCRCHHFNDDGLRPVCDIHYEDDGCAPDCPYCNGTDDAECLCGPSCEGNR